MNKKFVVGAVSTAVALALSGCGGGGSSAGLPTNGDGETLSQVATGFSLPTEISAVPASGSGSVASSMRSLGGSLRSLARAATDLADDSDYNTAQTRKYVEERSLEQFEIIEQIMNAIAQTNYADEENINADPYTAIVAWTDNQDGQDVKTLQPWVVESRMIVENGQDVNKLRAWIEEVDENGDKELIKAEFKIKFF